MPATSDRLGTTCHISVPLRIVICALRRRIEPEEGALPVTYREFVRLVADMRHAQREYFRTRSSVALETSKAAERRVDSAVKEAIEQPSLFAE